MSALATSYRSDPRRWPRYVPRLMPVFPIGQFTPSSQCGHRWSIPERSIYVCMVCHESGQDGHPAMQLDVRLQVDAAVLEPATVPFKPSNRPATLETRKQRRKRLFEGLSNLLYIAPDHAQ